MLIFFFQRDEICTLLETEFEICYSLLLQFRIAGASTVILNEELAKDTVSMLTAHSEGRNININSCIAFSVTSSGRPLRQPRQP